MPQLRGGCDDEIVTVKQILQLASSRFDEQPKCTVVIQLREQAKIENGRLFGNVQKELAESAGGLKNLSIELQLVHEFTNRELVAGEWVPKNDNLFVKRARWLITMAHVAVGKNEETNTGDLDNTWNLFDRSKAQRRLG